MSENNNINPAQINKEVKTQAVAKKTSKKKWWIGALALVLVLAIGGAVFNTLTQKTSTSKADSVKQSNNQSCTIKGDNKTCVNGIDNKNPKLILRNPRLPRASNGHSMIQPTQPGIEKPATNPYTGEKQ